MNNAIALFLFLSLQLHANAQDRRIVLRDITVVNVTNGKLLPHQAVIISRDRISDILPVKKYSNAAGDSIINASGKYLIPGLWDMHTHVWYADYFFPLFFANGITGFRDMFGTVDTLKAWKKAAAENSRMVPDLFFAGPIVDGPKPIWPGSIAVSYPSQARSVVDSIKFKLKTDFVKVYNLIPRDAYFAIADQCRKDKIDFEGHVPSAITAFEAVKAGQKSQEHLYGILESVSDSSDYYYEVVRQYTLPFLAKFSTNDSLLKDRIERRKMLLRTFNQQKLETLAKKMAASNTWICATFVVNYNIAHLDDSSLAQDDRMKYVGSFMRNFWNPKNDMRFRSQPKDYFTVSRKEFERKLQIVSTLHKHKVKFISGTDTPNPYCFPGFSLHDELSWLVKCGFSPLEALQTVTINPAIYFGIQKNFGTAEKGKVASLVILNKNPLNDIGNAQDINAVVLRGKMIDRTQLNSMLDYIQKLSQ